jgi:hypothetical protein
MKSFVSIAKVGLRTPSSSSLEKGTPKYPEKVVGFLTFAISKPLFFGFSAASVLTQNILGLRGD